MSYAIEANAATEIQRATVDWDLVKRLSHGDQLDSAETRALYTIIHHLENEVASLREALAAHASLGIEPDVYETRFTGECLWTEFPKHIALQKAAAGWALRKLYRRGCIDGRAQMDSPKGLPW